MASKTYSQVLSEVVRIQSTEPVVYKSHAMTLINSLQALEPGGIVMVVGTSFSFLGDQRREFLREVGKAARRGCSVGVLFGKEGKYLEENVEVLRGEWYKSFVLSSDILPGSIIIVGGTRFQTIRSFSKPDEEIMIDYEVEKFDQEEFDRVLTEAFSAYMLHKHTVHA